METFSKNLKEHVIRIINYEKKGMIPLIDEEIKLCEMQKVRYICKNELSVDDNNKKYHKEEIIVITLENLEEPLIVFVT